MAERIGQYLNRLGHQGASNFGDEASRFMALLNAQRSSPIYSGTATGF